MKKKEAAVSKPTSGNHSKIEAHTVVEKSVQPKNTKIEKFNLP
jgi:hypothetical protein